MRDNERNNLQFKIIDRLFLEKEVKNSLLSVIIDCEQMFGQTNVCHIYNATTSTVQKCGSKSEYDKIR